MRLLDLLIFANLPFLLCNLSAKRRVCIYQIVFIKSIIYPQKNQIQLIPM